MKRIGIYLMLLAAALLAPVERADVAQLRPVEVVCVWRTETGITLQTDTMDIGQGSSVAAALEDLRATTPAIVYLDTADYLLIGDGAMEEAKALRQVLKSTVRLCAAHQEVPLEEVSQYLKVHGELPGFSQWESGAELPVLTVENERLKISKKSEISA